MNYLVFICLVASAFVCLGGLALYYRKKSTTSLSKKGKKFK